MKIKNISKTGFKAGSHLQGHFTATYDELVAVSYTHLTLPTDREV